MDKKRETDSIDLIVSKSKELLDYQLTCYDTYFNKAGILISISSLFIPVSAQKFVVFLRVANPPSGGEPNACGSIFNNKLVDKLTIT